MPCFQFGLYGQRVSVACETAECARLLRTVYGAFTLTEEGPLDAAALSYAVRQGPGGTFLTRRGAEDLPNADGPGMFLLRFEQDLTVELQKRRPDLYFLHAAALERDGRTLLLVAESGGGKSTLTWGLLHHGLRYASDELAPIDLNALFVHGFPHALCLKADPPAPYLLPGSTLRTSRSRHVPVDRLPAVLAPSPLPLDAIVFLRYRPDLEEPAIRPMGAAEAATRLYVQALNPLAHPEDGLDAAVRVVRAARCYGLEAAGLGATCELVVRTLFG